MFNRKKYCQKYIPENMSKYKRNAKCIGEHTDWRHKLQKVLFFGEILKKALTGFLSRDMHFGNIENVFIDKSGKCFTLKEDGSGL